MDRTCRLIKNSTLRQISCLRVLSTLAIPCSIAHPSLWIGMSFGHFFMTSITAFVPPARAIAGPAAVGIVIQSIRKFIEGTKYYSPGSILVTLAAWRQALDGMFGGGAMYRWRCERRSIAFARGVELFWRWHSLRAAPARLKINLQ